MPFIHALAVSLTDPDILAVMIVGKYGYSLRAGQREGEGLIRVGYRALETTPRLYRSTDNGQTWDP